MTDEEQQALETAVGELPPRCRYTLGRLIERASYEDIGAELKLDAQTVQRLEVRAMEYLWSKVPATKGRKFATKKRKP
jgi:DNA-directed RNA polymerase specialized sigma24 family protein